MPEISEGLPHGRLWQYDQVRDNILRVAIGDTVEGFPKLNDLDAFVVGVVHHNLFPRTRPADVTSEEFIEAHPQRAPSSQGLRANNSPRYALWHGNLRLPSEVLTPKKHFHGRLLNPTATLLDIQTETSPTGGRDLKTLRMLLTAEPHSTGRGKSRSHKLLVATNEDASGRSVHYEPLPGDTADIVAELIHTEANTTARLVAARALQHVLYAGAPDSGKGA